MGRLIDADALCERIREIYDGYMLDEGCTPIEFENMVDEQPAVYDVEKVVAELEKASCWDDCYVVYLDKAIDIVKRGCAE